MAVCRLCARMKLSSDQELASQICVTCRGARGFVELSRMVRPIRPCRDCSGREFVRTQAHERSVKWDGSSATVYAAPLSIAFRRVCFGVKSPLPRVEITEDEVHHQTGSFEILICRSCGLTSWYALEPQKIPIGPEFMTELVRVPDADPYR
jgi:hypothetical protein